MEWNREQAEGGSWHQPSIFLAIFVIAFLRLDEQS
jgi:hypothetical protein